MITTTTFNVKFYEIDIMGIVYHANYPKWFLIGRHDYMLKAGIPIPLINIQGFFLPLSELECKYKSPARYGNKITVITKVIFISCVKLKYEYTIINKSTGNTIATGNTVHAWSDKNIRPINIEKAAPHIYTSLKKFAEIDDVLGR